VRADPLKTRSALGRAYWNHHQRVVASIQRQIMGWVRVDVLDGIEARAAAAPVSKLAEVHRELLRLLNAEGSATDPALRDAFKALYDEAQTLTFPTTVVYLRHIHALNEWTRNMSLATVDLDLLQKIDLTAHDDPTFSGFAAQMRAKLNEITSPPDVVRYSQFFEIYGEAMVLLYLRARVPTRRVTEAATETPDFECHPKDGIPFYVEVKTLDIVGGALRHDAMMVDAIDAQVDLQEQIDRGVRVAVAESEIDPYRRYGETATYDPRSLIRVVDTVREKFQQAFKPGQFALGPTIALAVADRLIIPGHECALAPYYYDDASETCLSGVLWHAAYGREGTPIFRHPDFDGRPALEGHLGRPGLFADPGRRFPGVALVALTQDSDRRVGYGLAARDFAPSVKGAADETEAALSLVCDAYNDAGNSHSSKVSRYRPRDVSPETSIESHSRPGSDQQPR